MLLDDEARRPVRQTTPRDRERPDMATATQAARGAAKPGWILAIVSLGVVLSSLDLFVVNVALPSIATGLSPVQH
ncbi:MAG: hypothetical protein QOJ73_599 [Streptosporangiaceae bacterium]|jgi:hypothetical protein|nr:hypothetical protein [Streptosporangiaceae bacterium]